MIKGIIYDWGGVICENPAEDFVQTCSKTIGATPDTVRKILSLYIDDFQRGTISETDIWKSVCHHSNITDYDYTQPIWLSSFKSFYRPQQPVIDSAQQLKSQGYTIGFLTNTEKPAMEFNLTLNYTFFDARVYSCNEGIIKPETPIYHMMAERMNLKPEECIMVDDKIENIKGAEKAGMAGIHYTSFIEYTCALNKLLGST